MLANKEFPSAVPVSVNLSTLYNGTPREYIQLLSAGRWIATDLGILGRLGIPDILKDGSYDIEYLSKVTGARVEPLKLIMDTSVCLGLFSKTAGRYVPNEVTPFLQDGPNSWKSMIGLYTGPGPTSAWDYRHSADSRDFPYFDALMSKDEGDYPFYLANKMSWPEYIEQDPIEKDRYVRGMIARAKVRGGAIAKAYDFSDVESYADIAGNLGMMQAQILKGHPGIQRAVLFDLPHMLATNNNGLSVEAVFASEGVDRDKVTLVSGDAFKKETLPRGVQTYFTAAFPHDLPKSRVVELFRNFAAVMRENEIPNSRLLVAEIVLPEPDSSLATTFKYLQALHMWGINGSLERSLNAWDEIFDESGFRRTGHFPAGEIDVLEARLAPYPIPA